MLIPILSMLAETMIFSKPCLICKKASHTYSDCPFFYDHEFLKTAFIKTCLFFSTVHQAQANCNVNALCAELNMNTPEEEEYKQIWENSQEDFELQDF